MKQQGSTIVLITHRPSILASTEAILILKEGTVAAFGPRDQVLAALAAPQPTPNAPA